MRSPRCSAERSSSAVSARSTRSDARPRRGRSLRKRPQLLHITRSYPSAGLQMRAIAIDESDASHPRQPSRGAIRAMRRRAAARSIRGEHSRSTSACTRRTGSNCSAVALRSETLRWETTDDTGSRDRRTSGAYPERRQQSGAVVPSDRIARAMHLILRNRAGWGVPQSTTERAERSRAGAGLAQSGSYVALSAASSATTTRITCAAEPSAACTRSQMKRARFSPVGISLPSPNSGTSRLMLL